VIRLDYSRPDQIFSVDVALKMLRRPAARRFMVAFGTAGAFVLMLWGTEVWRLNSATARLHGLEDRYSIVAAERKKTEALVSQLGVLSALQTEVSDVHLSGQTRVDEIVDVGNHLPPNVFLDSLEPRENEWRLAGHAGSMDAVGRAVVSLQQISGDGKPQLREIHNELDSTVEYELDFGRAAPK